MKETLIGCLIGAIITWLVSWIYYVKAGNELKQEANSLRNQTQLILTGLQEGGLVDLKWEDGVIIGFKRLTITPEGWDSSELGNAIIKQEQEQSLSGSESGTPTIGIVKNHN